jgi:vacuolar-type H+-ATPase subunit H
MNDERIKQVLNIEKEAGQIYDQAVQEAEQILLSAGREAEAILEKIRVESQKEAYGLVSDVQTSEESQRILAEAEENRDREIKLSAENFELAVRFVMGRITGEG